MKIKIFSLIVLFHVLFHQQEFPEYSLRRRCTLPSELAKFLSFSTVDLDLPYCSSSVDNDWMTSHGRSSVLGTMAVTLTYKF